MPFFAINALPAPLGDLHPLRLFSQSEASASRQHAESYCTRRAFLSPLIHALSSEPNR